MLNNLLPSSFNNVFKTNVENHDYNTRNALNFEHPNITNCDKSICYQGVKTWNNIPNHIKSSKSLNSFEASYKQLFLTIIRLFNVHYIFRYMYKLQLIS